MNHIEKFIIAILEDSLFYNKLLKKQFDDYFENLGVVTGSVFSIKTFTNTKDFMENISPGTDVVLIDFYLGEGETAPAIIEKIKIMTRSCKVIVISGVLNVNSRDENFRMKNIDFIPKDNNAPLKICKAIEAIYSQKKQN